MITHMAEHGCTIREIQPQSGHKDEATLIGYIVHSAPRIRQAYDEVFEQQNTLDIPVSQKPTLEPVQYKKLIMEKYIQGDIKRDMMNTMLKTCEETEKPNEKRDMAYI